MSAIDFLRAMLGGETAAQQNQNPVTSISTEVYDTGGFESAFKAAKPVLRAAELADMFIA